MCLVDEHTALLDRTVCRFRRSNSTISMQGTSVVIHHMPSVKNKLVNKLEKNRILNYSLIQLIHKLSYLVNDCMLYILRCFKKSKK